MQDLLDYFDVSEIRRGISNNIYYIAAAVSGCYLLKASYDSVSSYRHKSKISHQIRTIINEEKSKLSDTENKTDKNDVEFCYYLYFKCLKTILSNEFQSFEKKRREYFNKEKTDQYCSHVVNFYQSIKPIEQLIIKQIMLELGLNENFDSQVKVNEFDFNSINRKYYDQLDIDIPTELTSNKLSEVLNLLYEKTKFYIGKIREFNGIKKETLDDKTQILAEHMAFDYVYKKYSYSREVIQKAMSKYKLMFKKQKN